MLPKNQDNNAQIKIAKKALEDFVLDVEPVSNQVVVKTTTAAAQVIAESIDNFCLLYTSPSPRDGLLSRMPSSA